MRTAAANLDFERAAALRDRVRALKTRELGVPIPGRAGL
jgi:excinuclease UvrABC nuclease subunit